MTSERKSLTVRFSYVRTYVRTYEPPVFGTAGVHSLHVVRDGRRGAGGRLLSREHYLLFSDDSRREGQS